MIEATESPMSLAQTITVEHLVGRLLQAVSRSTSDALVRLGVELSPADAGGDEDFSAEFDQVLPQPWPDVPTSAPTSAPTSNATAKLPASAPGPTPASTEPRLRAGQGGPAASAATPGMLQPVAVLTASSVPAVTAPVWSVSQAVRPAGVAASVAAPGDVPDHGALSQSAPAQARSLGTTVATASIAVSAPQAVIAAPSQPSAAPLGANQDVAPATTSTLASVAVVRAPLQVHEPLPAVPEMVKIEAAGQGFPVQVGPEADAIAASQAGALPSVSARAAPIALAPAENAAPSANAPVSSRGLPTQVATADAVSRQLEPTQGTPATLANLASALVTGGTPAENAVAVVQHNSPSAQTEPAPHTAAAQQLFPPMNTRLEELPGGLRVALRRVDAMLQPVFDRAYALSQPMPPAVAEASLDADTYPGDGPAPVRQATAGAAPGAEFQADEWGDEFAGGAGGQVHNTFNVQVAMAGAGVQDRQQIQDALADLLRASARRHGLML